MPFGRNPRFDPRRSSPYCSTTTIVVFVALCLVGVWMMTSSTVVPVDVSSPDTNTEVKQEVTDTVGKQSEDSNGNAPVDARNGDTNDDSNGTASDESSQNMTGPDVTAENAGETTQGEVTDTVGKQSEDSNGNAPVDTRNGDTNDDSNDAASDESSQNMTGPDVTAENAGETTRGENSVIGNEGTKVESADTSETGTYSDANGKLESGEVVNEGGEIVKEDGDSKSGGNTTGGQEDHQDRIMEKDTVENGNAEQGKNTDKNSDQTENSEQEKSTAENEQDNTSRKNSDQTESNNKYESITGNSDKTPTDDQHQSDRQKNSEQESNSDADADAVQDDKGQGQIQEKVGRNPGKGTEEDSNKKKTESQSEEQGADEMLPSGAQSELLKENNTQNVAWSTQASESKNEKEVQASSSSEKQIVSSNWKLCNTTAGADYIPCLDNEEAIKKLRTTKHYEHRERHCPDPAPTCLVPLPDGYKKSIEWPASRDKIWYHNVPHTKLAVVKGHQNWVKVSGEYLTFPGGGTQFQHGALHYIDVIQEALPEIAWGKRSRVVLDIGCGVASFGGYLFDRDVLTMSFAPNDEHEAQVQFALERGIPAISAVMGTKRLPYPGMVFDVIHCARCRVPWHIEGGMLLLELNRLLRPGGYFVWSATPVYQKLAEDVEIWKDMKSLMKSICWEMVNKTKDVVDHVGLAIFRKPSNNSCYEKRKQNSPPFCQESDDPNAAWNVPLQACMHKLPADRAARGSQWPEQWPLRLETAPYWLNNSQTGVYGKPAPEDFKVDQEHWNTVVAKSYLNGMGIDWSKVRNVMDMRAVYGGFAAALRDTKVWVMNVVSIDSPDTLPIIYERGLFGMYHDWCESFSTYPRSYDLLHADHLFSRIKKRCKILPLMAEVDRMLRPEGKLIVRDTAEVISEVESIAKSLNWEIRMTFSKQNEGILFVMKTAWRPKELEVKR